MRATALVSELGRLVLFVTLGSVLSIHPCTAQASSAHSPSGHATTLSTEGQRFVEATTQATRRFTDRSQAIRAGYRKLGPDFPGMGEHWVHPGRIVQGSLDSAYPSVLSYVVIDGVPRLVGVAFTLPLGPDEAPPDEPFGQDLWHDHSGDVNEETLLLNHPASMHSGGSGYRLSMAHVWTDLENPDGVVAQNNWHLPWVRVGLTPPEEGSVEAARGVSLSYGGRDFYLELISRATSLTEEEFTAVSNALQEHAARVEALVVRSKGAGGVEAEHFADLWRDFWKAVRRGVRDGAWADLAPLSEPA